MGDMIGAFRVGHSPDPDDACMFHAMTTGAIDTGGRRYEHVLLDIETLTKHGLNGEYEESILLPSIAGTSLIIRLKPKMKEKPARKEIARLLLKPSKKQSVQDSQ